MSDHAIYCNKYDHHYFVDGHNVKIPLRWMAWEAVLLVSNDHFLFTLIYIFLSFIIGIASTVVSTRILFDLLSFSPSVRVNAVVEPTFGRSLQQFGKSF